MWSFKKQMPNKVSIIFKGVSNYRRRGRQAVCEFDFVQPCFAIFYNHMVMILPCEHNFLIVKRTGISKSDQCASVGWF
jgi:hypothetical protein